MGETTDLSQSLNRYRGWNNQLSWASLPQETRNEQVNNTRLASTNQLCT